MHYSVPRGCTYCNVCHNINIEATYCSPLRPHPLVPSANVVPRAPLYALFSTLVLRAHSGPPVCIALGHLVSSLVLLVHRIVHREPSRGRTLRGKTMASHSVRPVPIQNNRVEFRSTRCIVMAGAFEKRAC